MEIRLDIPFEQLLRALKQLTPAQRRKAKAVLDETTRTKASKEENGLAELLLSGPVFSNEQLKNMADTRKSFAQWRDR
jgi:uncharacterized protein (DUF1778 family)